MEIKNVRKVSFWRIFFATLAALLVASIISIIMFFSALGGVMGAFMSDKDLSSEVKDNTFLYLKLDKPVGDVGFSRINASNFSIDEQQGLGEIIYGLEKAKKDPKIKGIFIETGSVNSGYGNLFELREAIKDFEKSGKKVVFYAKGEAISLKALYLSTVTKDNYVFPESNVEFLGLSSELMFFKNTLDKLGVEVQVIRGENNDFKSAVEPYFRTDMSDSSRLQVERFMNGIWNKLLTDISTDKGISVEKLNNFASNATILNGRDAAKNGLFSETKYRDEILDLLKKYADSEKDTPLYSFNKYARNEYNKKVKAEKGKNAIALIFAEGDITVDGKGIASESLCKNIRDARLDDNIKTIVLRVNSPGGSALASEEIWREVKLAADKKKVYVSMGNLAASGGYYISSAGTRIFADPTTITGSIGVFGVIPNFGNALNKHLGITFDGVKTNKFGNISLMKKLSDEELAIIQRSVNDIYEQFIQRVSDGRKLSKDRVKALAKGRVWLGTDAKNIGLVDEFGGLVATLNYAKKQVGDLPVVVYPKVKDNDLTSLLEMLKDEEISTDEDAKIPAELMSYYKEIKKLESRFGIQMRMPYEIKF